jgi:hypothetical protein
MAKLTEKEVKWFQDAENKFTDHYLKGVKRIPEDGINGHDTKIRTETVKYYMGFGASRKAPDSELSDYFKKCLKSPKGAFIPRRTRIAGAKRRAGQRARASKIIPGRFRSMLWGGCRGVTDKAIAIVGGRYTVSSRKRWQTFGNPSSAHFMGNRRKDAVDWRTANNQRLMDEVANGIGGPSNVRDYQFFNVRHNGMEFQCQMIAVTHGTGPHLHLGVERR